MVFEACVEAGPDRCGLHEASAAQVKARFDALFAKLKRRPIAVSTNSTRATALDYGVVDYALVKWLVLVFLYSPYATTPGVAGLAGLLFNWLREAEEGDAAAIWAVMSALQGISQCECPRGAPPTSEFQDAFHAISCGDGDRVEDTVEELEAHQARIMEDSFFGDLWTFRAVCV